MQAKLNWYSFVFLIISCGSVHGMYLAQQDLQTDKGAVHEMYLTHQDLQRDKDNMTTLSSCHCKTDDGCTCKGHDGDFKVTVVLIDSHVKDGHNTVIWGHFQVGKDHFVKRFTVKTLKSFCRTNKGTIMCFIIHRFVVHGYIHGYIDLAYPKAISLGLFTLPVL